jgi:hypothetical protein
MILSSLKLVASRTLSHKQLLVAVVSGVFLAVTILAGSVVYTNSLKDLAVQDALRPQDTADIDLLVTANFAPLNDEAIALLRETVQAQVEPAIEGYGTLSGFAGRSETFLVAADIGLGAGVAPPAQADDRRAWLATNDAFLPHITIIDGELASLHDPGRRGRPG